MYVLTNNGAVVSGPREWSKSIFERVLSEELNITYSLPTTYTSTEVISVSDNIKLYSVVFDQEPNYDALTEQLAGPFWEFSTVATASYIKTHKNIEAVKNELKSKVAELRWNKEISGTKVTLQGQEIPVHTTREDRAMYLQAFQIGPLTNTWKFSNGVWLTLNHQELGLIVKSVVEHVQAAFDEEAARVVSIDNAVTLEELSNIAVSLHLSNSPN